MKNAFALPVSEDRQFYINCYCVVLLEPFGILGFEMLIILTTNIEPRGSQIRSPSYPSRRQVFPSISCYIIIFYL